MNSPLHPAAAAAAASLPPAGQQERALLDLIESDRDRQCSAIRDAARTQAALVRAQAEAAARERMRSLFEEQRRLRDARLAAAQARVATAQRLHEQRRSTALLQRAWQELPDVLTALWRCETTRRAWVDRVVADARRLLPAGAWQVVHAPDWPAAERQAVLQALAGTGHPVPGCTPDAAITAGIKITATGNVVDGTLAGLLSDRADFEARLLRKLEREDRDAP